MKSESNIKPSAFSVEKCGDIAEIVLFENIEEKEHDGETVFVYDEYRINVPYRETLAASVEANFDGWMSAAKAHAYNSAAAKVREKRNKLIAETDYIMLTDYTLSLEKQQAYADYRQALRDITEQDGFPFDVVFPAEVEKQLESEK